LFQNLLSGRDPIIFPHQYSGRVWTIHVFENFSGLFQAGEKIGNIWENSRILKSNIHKYNEAVFQRFGTSCPSTTCGHCEIHECFFREFIRDYWECPHAD
jgi:hypothetical protein